MKKSTKGALAAAAAGTLLMGGAGSLAFWSASGGVGGGTITAGHLSLDDTTGADDTCANAPWLLDSAGGSTSFDPTTDKIVPGDVLTKICTYNVVARGKHLTAALTTSGGSSSGDLTAQTVTGASFTIDAVPDTTITTADNGKELKATLTITFDGAGATNLSQDDQLVLTNYTVNATQSHP